MKQSKVYNNFHYNKTYKVKNVRTMPFCGFMQTQHKMSTSNPCHVKLQGSSFITKLNV